MRNIFRELFAFTKTTTMFFTVIAIPFTAVAMEATKANPSIKSPLVIKSQVKGSQEQPNVIYIMPWQGIENPISIEGNKQKIVLPNFKPINPKSFKQQARLFYQVNTTKSKQVSLNK